MARPRSTSAKHAADQASSISHLQAPTGRRFIDGHTDHRVMGRVSHDCDRQNGLAQEGTRAETEIVRQNLATGKKRQKQKQTLKTRTLNNTHHYNRGNTPP